MFLGFLTNERPVLTALKQMILNEIKQSNALKPQTINFFLIFCKFIPHKGNFCWKVSWKVIYTFYLKHQKYPFWTPIFHPLSETESYAFTIVHFILVSTRKEERASPSWALRWSQPCLPGWWSSNFLSQRSNNLIFINYTIKSAKLQQCWIFNKNSINFS